MTTDPMTNAPPARRRSSAVVNLCFHGIGTPQRQLERDEERYWVDVAQFEDFLGVIRRFSMMRITFDDGNASDVDHALPALLSHGLRAEFFLIADRVDRPGSVSSSAVRELVRSGMGVGSHGLHHRPWRTLHREDLEAELFEAPRVLSGIAGQPVRTAACLFGSYDRRVLTAARRAGVSRIYTVDRAPAWCDAWLQARFTIESVDTPETIERLGRAGLGVSVATATRRAKNLVKRLR
jgi:peptidoglycan/xylan/chitin deacetylase (PgdA/CDA1 family)